LAAAVRARPAPAGGAAGRLAFALLVPARDEAASIDATLHSIRELDHPPELVRVIVVADNCADRTAEVAEGLGAIAWRRRGGDDGKGAALAWALERMRAHGPEAAAVVVVDADCIVAPNLLNAIEHRLRAGARVVQVPYRVANPDGSPIAALRWASFALINDVRPLGKATLGLSAGLLGTGMAFSRELLATQPWTASSLLEDQEQHLALVAAGERVEFAHETWVASAMPTSLTRSTSQALRWDAGRVALIRAWTPRLILSGLRRRDAAQVHAGLEPLVPPQSLLLAANLAGCGIGLRASANVRRLALANVAGQLVFVAGGLAFARAPASVWRALLRAPVLAIWKLGLLLRLLAGRGPTRWVRTEREPQAAVERPESRRAMRPSSSRLTNARSSGSARGERRNPAPAQPAR
jgi:cellulose synthase/poly-beta-1,6-N-acetylglucosamine synthase-like glycosyltransferase